MATLSIALIYSNECGTCMELNEMDVDGKTTNSIESGSNNLYPVFLKLDALKTLVVGGGKVALEKIHSLLGHAPQAQITLVSLDIHPDILSFLTDFPQVKVLGQPYNSALLEGQDLVIVATDDHQLNLRVKQDAHAHKIICNVADTPEACDFYLSSIVHKGHLKIAISTNGRSPSMAKRLKELFQEIIPDDLNTSLDHLYTIRQNLKGDFAHKVKRLNHITSVLVNKEYVTSGEKQWRRWATYSILAFVSMILGYYLFSYYPLPSIPDIWTTLKQNLTTTFWLCLAVGFLAQMVDGALSMGYGVTCTTVMMTMGIPPAAISASIHTAEVFTTGVSGYSHYRFGNVNKKLFKVLVIPGVIGAIAGAALLVFLGEHNAKLVKPLLAGYCAILGLRILYYAWRLNTRPKKVKRAGWLAAAGGFLDSFGGGGWGPLVTSTLISKGRSPQYVIGSVSLSEFFITFSSAVSFFVLMGISHWPIILGLMIGGVIAAPLAARLAGKLPRKVMFIAVGVMVLLWSLRIIWQVIAG